MTRSPNLLFEDYLRASEDVNEWHGRDAERVFKRDDYYTETADRLVAVWDQVDHADKWFTNLLRLKAHRPAAKRMLAEKDRV